MSELSRDWLAASATTTIQSRGEREGRKGGVWKGVEGVGGELGTGMNQGKALDTDGPYQFILSMKHDIRE